MKRILVLSDVHYGADNFNRLMESRAQDMDDILFLGDGLETVLSNISPTDRNKLQYVEGNCDGVYQQHDALTTIEGKRIFMTHGNRYHVKSDYITLRYKASEVEANIVLFGHTHRQYYEKIAGVHFVNPGSLGYGGEYAEIIIENGEIFVILNKLN